MPDQPPNVDREQTDESLRVEREKADAALGEGPTAIDETADAVIEKARMRADAILAARRAKTDVQAVATNAPHTSRSPSMIQSERLHEDETVRKERAEADETVRHERADRAAALEREREETDKDLSRERNQSDHRVSARDEFLGIVSHDLRTLLTSIVGYAALIANEESQQKHNNKQPIALTYAKRIQRSGARMNRLIGDLVDVASIHAGALAVTCEVGDPTSVVAEAIETFQEQASAGGISLSAELAASLPPAAAFDSARLLQVLINLLSNAIKFTAPDGRVVVRAERAGDDICFSVSDTGKGIPSDKLEAVFERFLQVTDDRRGVGLGLYISKCIIQGHAGKIWVESTIGEGSTFRFTLPIHHTTV